MKKLKTDRRADSKAGVEVLEQTGEPEQTAQEWEAGWWGNATQTFGEEVKQLTYANKMGLKNLQVDGRWPVYDLDGRSVLDIGGGPVSILLKTINGWGMVVDPCPFPDWVTARYEAVGIQHVMQEAEKFDAPNRMTEAWIYNVLQHVVDPEKVIATARRNAHLIRLFEWIETETNVGHPHAFHADELNQWLGGVGEIGIIDENSAYGLGYWGVFSV